MNYGYIDIDFDTEFYIGSKPSPEQLECGKAIEEFRRQVDAGIDPLANVDIDQLIKERNDTINTARKEIARQERENLDLNSMKEEGLFDFTGEVDDSWIEVEMPPFGSPVIPFQWDIDYGTDDESEDSME